MSKANEANRASEAKGANDAGEATHTVEVRRRLPAPPTEVYAAWTDPAVFPAWIAPAGRVLMDPRVDGLFFIDMLVDGRHYPHYGRYLLMESPQRLEFTWMSEATQGNESCVAIRFEPDGDGTRLHLKHTGLPTAEIATCHHEGWTSFVDDLARRCEEGRAGRH